MASAVLALFDGLVAQALQDRPGGLPVPNPLPHAFFLQLVHGGIVP
jgi:hypothetical protein